MSLTELSAVLWIERRLLERLLFKLEEEQLVLTSGRARWLPEAAAEVEAVIEEIRTSDLGRAFEVDQVAAELGIAPGASLLELSQAAPEPWDELLRSHRDAFITLTRDVAGTAEGNRELLQMSYRITQETLMSLHESVSTYDGQGQVATPGDDSPFMIDRAL
jgi:hypothetical protein